MNVHTLLGVIRSLLIYYAIPGRIQRLTRFYSQFVQPGDICFDLGAHVGNHTRAMRRLGAEVITVEPQPAFNRLLRSLYRSDPGVILLEQAVGTAQGEAPLFVSPRTPTVSTLSSTWTQLPYFANVNWDQQINVSVTTLDALIDEYGLPTFCKMDVEGFELEILRGLSRPLPLVSFEYLPAARELAFACVARLEELGGYEYNWSVGEQMELNPGWVSPSQAVQYLQTLPSNAREGNLYARIRRTSDDGSASILNR